MSGLDAGFLKDIVADPFDDTPRLVYADYLDEQGQYDRAEFIRIQCQEARLPQGAPPPVVPLYDARVEPSDPFAGTQNFFEPEPLWHIPEGPLITGRVPEAIARQQNFWYNGVLLDFVARKRHPVYFRVAGDTWGTTERATLYYGEVVNTQVMDDGWMYVTGRLLPTTLIGPAERNLWDEREALRKRAKELLDKHEFEWAAAALGSTALRGGSYGANDRHFRRGFVDGLTVHYYGDWLAHGPELVRHVPVTSLSFIERHPTYYGGAGYMWWGHNPESEPVAVIHPHYVPWAWFAYLKDDTGSGVSAFADRRKHYQTVGDAKRALSRAALAWARNKAGLPPLPPAPPAPKLT